MGWVRVVGLLAVAVGLVVAAPVRAGAAARPLDAYQGLGAWVSLYDTPAWRDPAGTVEVLAGHGVRTLFLETSNYRQRSDLVREPAVAEFLDSAHALGLLAVAWYLPSLAAPVRDLRRSLAAIDFESAGGQRFDSFALDIESTIVRNIPLRNARALGLVSGLRKRTPADYPLGAITIAPVGASPSYWPRYPFAPLSKLVDVFLPMAYFTARTKGASGVRAYTLANVAAIRAQAQAPLFPIHAIGGVSPRAKPAEVRAFVEAASACGATGASLWEFAQTTDAEWEELSALDSNSPTQATADPGCAALPSQKKR
jgi:hypothetical protein